jgi:hypothetical protein
MIVHLFFTDATAAGLAMDRCIRLFLIFFSTNWCWIDVLTIERRKYNIMHMRNISQTRDINGLLSLKVSGANNCFFWLLRESMRVFYKRGNHVWNFNNISSTVSFRKRVIINSIWRCTLMIALPIKVAVKNVLKGILKCPQVIPAKSNRGLGIEAHSSTVMNPYFCSMWKISSLIRSMRGVFLVYFICSSFSISFNYSFYSSETFSLSSSCSSSSSSSICNSPTLLFYYRCFRWFCSTSLSLSLT